MSQIVPKLNYSASEQLQLRREKCAKAEAEGLAVQEIPTVLEMQAAVELWAPHYIPLSHHLTALEPSLQAAGIDAWGLHSVQTSPYCDTEHIAQHIAQHIGNSDYSVAALFSQAECATDVSTANSLLLSCAPGSPTWGVQQEQPYSNAEDAGTASAVWRYSAVQTQALWLLPQFLQGPS